ncbi:hypothetical protein M407DRAFT_200362 [Tulasnella calospora MUT 4182]|uniref:Uncharacterized protein n=1 Tax=Tulasnella calospora MUT 4182 TaxID=1051891 RepID=A0A0C3K3E1_9AGAM|nr:hypothetical protein M407DRAFT_200362 [Tulasnella calospora MUT 4182]
MRSSRCDPCIYTLRLFPTILPSRRRQPRSLSHQRSNIPPPLALALTPLGSNRTTFPMLALF